MRESLKGVKVYRVPSVQGLGLQSNTNRMGPNPASAKLATVLGDLDLNAYPDNEATALRQALARLHGLDPASFLVANGSNETFDLMFKTFLDPGQRAAFPDPSFSMYPYYANINAVSYVEVALNEAFELDATALLETQAQLYVLCSPNNPTGNALDPRAVEAVLASGTVTIVDEAYAEFSDYNWLQRIEEFPNLLVTRTLSKAYGMAGLRVGYVAGHPKLIEQISKARLPYNLNALSQYVATDALSQQRFVKDYVAMIVEQRALWGRDLEQRGFFVWPSQANFVLARVPHGVERDKFVGALGAAGVVIRSAGAHRRLCDCVRVTLGTPQDRVLFLDAVDAVLA